MDDSGQAIWLAVYWAMLAAGVAASTGTWIWIGVRWRRRGPLVPYEPRGRVPWDFGHVLVILLVFESPLLLALLSVALGADSAKNGSTSSRANWATACLRPNSSTDIPVHAGSPDIPVCANRPNISVHADSPDVPLCAGERVDPSIVHRRECLCQFAFRCDTDVLVHGGSPDVLLCANCNKSVPASNGTATDGVHGVGPLRAKAIGAGKCIPPPLAGKAIGAGKCIPSPLAGEGGERSEPGEGEHKHVVGLFVAAVGSHPSQGGSQAGHDRREGPFGALASEQREPPIVSSREPPVDQLPREERRTSERAIDDSSAPDRADTYHPVFDLLRRDGSAGTWLLCIAVVVLVAPVTEELVFRLVLQGWLAKEERLWRRRLGVLRIVRPGWLSVVVVALWFAAQHARGAEQPLDPHVLRQLLVVTGVLGVLTALFTLLMLRVGCRASLRDLGLAGDRLAGDLRLGVIAFLAVGPPVMALQDVLGRFVLPKNVAPDPIPLFVLAIALGGLYYRTGRIVPSIVLHMMLNGASLLVAWVAIGAGLMASTTMPLR